MNAIIGLSLNLFCASGTQFSLFPESYAGTVLRRWKPAGKLSRSGIFDNKLPADAIHGLQVTQVLQGSWCMMYTPSLGYAYRHVSGCSPPGLPISE